MKNFSAILKVLAKFNGLTEEKFVLHLKVYAYRFNCRNVDISISLFLIRSLVLNRCCSGAFGNLL